jgi:hypothetical protein
MLSLLGFAFQGHRAIVDSKEKCWQLELHIVEKSAAVIIIYQVRLQI